MRPVTRREVFAGAAVAAAGCSSSEDGDAGGGGTGTGTATGNPALASADTAVGLTVGSSAFDDGGDVPRRYGKGEENVNPPLSVSGVTDGADSLVVVVDDPDAVDVVGEIFVHWLVWNVPPDTASIPEGWTPETAVEGENDFGNVGYDGPAPPDEPHTYRFKCFALDATMDLEAGATVDALGDAMAGRVRARGQVAGSYAP